MTLVTIWFFIWTLLWAIYFMTDGFDLGVGAMLPFLGRNETERRILYNATGPLWDGNEVWLIAAGGVTFAAFPRTYAVMFSAFHEALTLLLLALIVRGLSFELRSKVASACGSQSLRPVPIPRKCSCRCPARRHVCQYLPRPAPRGRRPPGNHPDPPESLRARGRRLLPRGLSAPRRLVAGDPHRGRSPRQSRPHRRRPLAPRTDRGRCLPDLHRLCDPSL